MGYQFKHALIQDAAYESMLKSRRQILHRKVGEVLETQFVEVLASQPEQIALHYTVGGLSKQAIPLWLKAGQLANQKHAHEEAIKHLETGLGLLPNLENEKEKHFTELEFLLPLGSAIVVSYGYWHPKALEVFSIAKDLAQKVEVNENLAFILYNLMVVYLQPEDYGTVNELMKYSLELGKDPKIGYLFNLFANHGIGCRGVQSGDHETGIKVLKEKVIDYYNPLIKIPPELTPGGNVKINANSYLAISLRISGYSDQAKKIVENQLSLTEQFQDSRTLFHIYTNGAWCILVGRAWKKAENLLKSICHLPRDLEIHFSFSSQKCSIILPGHSLAMEMR